MYYQRDRGVGVERAAVSQQFVISGHRDGSVRVSRLPRLDLARELRLHYRHVRAVAVHSDTDRFASISRDRQIFIWDGDGNSRHFESPPGMVRSLEFSPDGKSLWGDGWENFVYMANG